MMIHIHYLLILFKAHSQSSVSIYLFRLKNVGSVNDKWLERKVASWSMFYCLGGSSCSNSIEYQLPPQVDLNEAIIYKSHMYKYMHIIIFVSKEKA